MPLVYETNPPIQMSWIKFEGPDARDFLHRITTVDLRSLSPGRGHPGFFLTPNGKVIGYFHLWCLSQDGFAFEFDAGHDLSWKRALIDVIEKFHFSERFSLHDCSSEFKNYWHFPDRASGLEMGKTVEERGQRSCHWGVKDFGRPMVSVWGSRPPGDSIPFEQVEGWRIAACRPGLDHELTFDSNPLELGMREAIAEAKGCYPGQETVEKIISLGSPSRRLVLFQGSGNAPARGAEISGTTGNVVGKVTSAQTSGANYFALSVLGKTVAREKSEFLINGKTAVLQKVASYEA